MPDAETALNIGRDLIVAGKFEVVKSEMAYEVGPVSYKNIKVRKFFDVFDYPSSSFSNIKKYRGEDFLIIWLTGRLEQLANLFKVGASMNEDELEMLAEILIDDYYYFTVGDLKAFSKMAVKGVFGKVFNRLDVPVLVEWFEQYRVFRIQEAQKYNQEKHLKIKTEQSKVVQMPKELKELSNKLAKKHIKEIQSNSKDFTLEDAIKTLGHYWNEEYRRIKEQKRLNNENYSIELNEFYAQKYIALQKV